MSLLSVTVKKAKYSGIQAQQLNTYITLKLQNVKSTTVTVKGANPCWEQDFLFEINDLNTGLLIEVWSKGMIWDRALGYHYMTLQTVSYSNECHSEKWINLDSELEIRGNDIIGTKCFTGHTLLIDCRFEIPFDLENIKATDFQQKLEILNNTIDQEARMEQVRRQILYNAGHSGYSEDSDYTSDLNYPIVGQGPNSSASQFHTAANQLMTPQRSLEISRENSYERDDQYVPMNYSIQKVHENYCEYNESHVGSVEMNAVFNKTEPSEPLFYNSRPQYMQNEYPEYSINNWFSEDQVKEEVMENSNNSYQDIDYYFRKDNQLSQRRCPRRKPSLERQLTIYDEYLHCEDSNVDIELNSISEIFPNTCINSECVQQNSRYIQVDEDRQWDSGGKWNSSCILHENKENKKSLPQRPSFSTNIYEPNWKTIAKQCSCELEETEDSRINFYRKKLPELQQEMTTHMEYTAKKLPPTPDKSYDQLRSKNTETTSVLGKQLPHIETHLEENYYSNFIYEPYIYDENNEKSLFKDYKESSNYDGIHFSPSDVMIEVPSKLLLDNSQKAINISEQTNSEYVAGESFDEKNIFTNNDILENYTQSYDTTNEFLYQNVFDNIHLDNNYPITISSLDTYEKKQDIVMGEVIQSMHYMTDDINQYFESDVRNQSYNNEQFSDTHFRGIQYYQGNVCNQNLISNQSINEKTCENISFIEKCDQFHERRLNHLLESTKCEENYSAQLFENKYFEEEYKAPLLETSNSEKKEAYQVLEMCDYPITEETISSNEACARNSEKSISNTYSYCFENYYNNQLTNEHDTESDQILIQETNISAIIPSYNLENSCIISQDSTDSIFHDTKSEIKSFSQDTNKNHHETYDEEYTDIKGALNNDSFEKKHIKQTKNIEQIKIDVSDFLNSESNNLLVSTKETKDSYIQKNSNNTFNSRLEKNEYFITNTVASNVKLSVGEENKDSQNIYEISEISVDDNEYKKLSETFVTRTGENTSPVLMALTSFSKSHIQPVVSIANDMINRISTSVAKETTTSYHSTVTQDNVQLIDNEFNQEETMEEDNYADEHPEKSQRKGSEQSHYSYQSRLSNNSIQNVQMQKVYQENSYDYNYQFDESDNKRDTCVQINDNDSFISENNSDYSKPKLLRSDSLKSLEHRRRSYGQNFSTPHLISRAESYQRGYFNDQEVLDRTEIILGSATNGEYIIFDEALDRYDREQEEVVKKSRDDSLIDLMISDVPRGNIQKQASLDESVQMDTPPRSPPEPPADEEILELTQSPVLQTKDRTKMTPKQKWHVAYNKIIMQLNMMTFVE